MIIRCLVACQLLLAGLLLTPAPAADAATTVRLDGVTVSLRDGTRQVVTVNRTSAGGAGCGELRRRQLPYLLGRTTRPPLREWP